MNRSRLYAVCITLLLSANVFAEARRQLVLGTWPDYISPEVVANFEKEYNVSVIQNFFNSEDDRDEQIIRYGNDHFDAAIVSDFMLPLYMEMNWLEKLDLREIPNKAYIDKIWLDHYSTKTDYGIPYFWGASGIAYRKDIVRTPPTSWMDILKPDSRHKGHIRMIDDSVDLVTLALLGLGGKNNDITDETLEKIRGLIASQKAYVSSYEYVDISENSSLVTGEDHMAFIYNGDAVVLREYNHNIAFAFPKEGSSSWMDFWVVMRESHNKDLAKAFINFINTPKWAAINAEFTSYATPNKKAISLTSEEYKNNPIIFFEPEQQEKITPYADLTPIEKRKINSLTADILD